LDLTIKCVNPFDEHKPHLPQQQFLTLPRTGGLKLMHFVSGRGGGKTLAAVLLALQVVLDEPGTRGCVLSPTFQKLKDVFLQAWIDLVPKELYKLNRSEMTLTMINGSIIWLRSRYVNNPSRGKDAHRGLDVSWVIDDEAAEGFDRELTTNVLACCRRAGRNRFYACTTTPRLNEYHDFATSQGHNIVYSSSRDNPHLPADWVNAISGQMSIQQAQREIEGRWVALEGLVWDRWVNKSWPNGNLHSHVFNPDLPWHLWLDLGVGNGAYLAVQPVQATKLGQRLYNGVIWVIVGEHMPTHDGSASRAMQRVKERFGQPSVIVCGADMNTRSNSDGRTPMFFASQIFPGTQVFPIKGWRADKQIQYNQATAMVETVAGERRLCMSDNLISLEDATRGIKQLIQQDTWPENAGKVIGTFLNKEGRLEHVRDALLYGAVHVNSPNFAGGRKAA
jgi:hypothetical protein